MIGYFIESMSLVAMILPLLIACIAMHIGAGVHSSLILRDLGVPLGLVMAFVGFNVLIGIIYYYNDEIGPGVAIGLLGIVYAQIAYICLYFLSFKMGDPKKLDPPLMNWHWLEVSGFVIFMFLAPVSLAEYGFNFEDDKKEEKMELRIQELERKLDLLSQQPTQ